jgi:hypothetical protein
MFDWNDFKKVFGMIDHNKVMKIFPTVTMFLEFGIGERDETNELKYSFIKTATHIANAEYQDYRRANPDDVEAKEIYLKYQFWIDNILIDLEKRIALSKQTNENSKVVKKNTSNITHEEVILALTYIISNLKGAKPLPTTNIVKLLYFLRRQEQPSKISNTTEYTQYSTFKTDSSTGADKNQKEKSEKVATFLNSIGLSSIANQLLKDFK